MQRSTVAGIVARTQIAVIERRGCGRMVPAGLRRSSHSRYISSDARYRPSGTGRCRWPEATSRTASEMLSRTHRPDEMRGDDDDKIGSAGSRWRRARQLAGCQPRQLIDGRRLAPGAGRQWRSFVRPAVRLRCAPCAQSRRTVVPFMLRLLAVFTSASVTDGFSCKLIMPLPLLSTVGVKSRPTPYCFHSIEFGV